MVNVWFQDDDVHSSSIISHRSSLQPHRFPKPSWHIAPRQRRIIPLSTNEQFTLSRRNCLVTDQQSSFGIARKVHVGGIPMYIKCGW